MRNDSQLAAIFIILLGVNAAVASGQSSVTVDPAPAIEVPAATGELETSDQTVKIEASADDDQIAGRLRDILTASGRYENLALSVRDGIVFLEGTATREDHRVWASDLAGRTEDVVAVVNNLEIDPPPVLEQDAVADQLGQFFNNFVRALPLIGVGLLLLIASVLLAKLVTYIISPLLAYLTDSQLLRNVARKVVALLVVVAGVVLFLQISGLTGVALTVLSGTGVLGLIVGFAFRDIAENFLASILLSVQTPFHLGDVIEVAGYTGVVQKVTPRGTVLVDFDGNHIQIANSTVYKSTLKNLTANPRRRLNFDVGIGYDASVKLA